jgi:hypothetical protein
MLRDGNTAGRMLGTAGQIDAYWRARRMNAELNRLHDQKPNYPMQIGVSPVVTGDRSLFRRIFGLVWRKVG